jgi:hypothetical protein
MRRRLKVKRHGKATLAVAALMAGPVAVACTSGPSAEEWAATDGAAGRINLNEVQEAFKKSNSATDFEDRVNEIYEGDHIVLIRAKQDGKTLVLEGWEDLNSTKAIEDGTDDLLFEVVKANDQHELRGHGANGYYRSGFGGGNFLFTYMILSSMGPRGYYYNSSPGRYNTMSRNRTNYRSSNRYRSQVSRNSNYFSKQKSFAGSRYNQPKSASRNSYLNSQKSSGAFKSSGTGVRSRWGGGSGSSRSSISRGGFRGGGGGASVIGAQRPSRR